MIERDLEHWRWLPHLRIDEAVEISGVSRRTVTGAIERGDLGFRHIGKIKVIPIESFRSWIGEDTAEDDPHVHEIIDRAANAKADRILRKVR